MVRRYLVRAYPEKQRGLESSPSRDPTSNCKGLFHYVSLRWLFLLSSISEPRLTPTFSLIMIVYSFFPTDGAETEDATPTAPLPNELLKSFVSLLRSAPTRVRAIGAYIISWSNTSSAHRHRAVLCSYIKELGCGHPDLRKPFLFPHPAPLHHTLPTVLLSSEARGEEPVDRLLSRHGTWMKN